MGRLVLERPVGWEQRLSETIAEVYFKPYHPKKWNCAKFVHLCVSRMVNMDVPYTYKGSLEKSVDNVLNRIDSKLASRGDVVMCDIPDSSLGICVGRNAMFVGEQSLIPVSMDKITQAWRV